MTPECNSSYLDFPRLGPRQVLADFDGGDITSDGGALLLRKTEELTAIIRQFATCFTDHRNPDLIEHTVEELIAQRVYALALGDEDLNDHEDLRRDPRLATVVGQDDPTGQSRPRRRDRGKAPAGKSTLNRLELTPVGADTDSRYKKITWNTPAVEQLLVTLFLQAPQAPPERIVLDLDATDDPIHGPQLGRSFQGSYKNYCSLPLDLSCGARLVCARLRPSDSDVSAGALKRLKRVVAPLRRAWPAVRILIRGDRGFGREPSMRGWEGDGVDDLFGRAQKARLVQAIADELQQAKGRDEETSQAARIFKDFRDQTPESWSRERRVVAQAEPREKGPNPRFVVTSLSAEERPAKPLYEADYCGRGEMENRIKEQQLHLFADRTRAHTMRANQIRLFFSSIASVLREALRRLGLSGTELAEASCQTIRLKRLKIGAWVRGTVRTVWVRLASSCPDAAVFRRVHAQSLAVAARAAAVLRRGGGLRSGRQTASVTRSAVRGMPCVSTEALGWWCDEASDTVESGSGE